MDSFEIQTSSKKIEISDQIRESFKSPLIFYLCRLDIIYLCIFIIIDFQKNELIYINTFSDENEDKFKNKYEQVEWTQTPHSSLAIGKPYEFINFPFNIHDKRSTTFRTISTITNKMNIFSAEDLPLDHRNEPFENSDTSQREGEYFWISYTHKNKDGSDYYQMKDDFSEAKLIFTEEDMKAPPHQIIHIDNWVFFTGFYDRNYKTIGKTFGNPDLIKHLKALQNIAPDKTIHDLIFSYDKDLKQVGNFFAYNYNDGKIHTIETVNAPSHIEYDKETNTIYVLSNNITTLPGQTVFYLGPGYVEKFKIYKDSIIKEGTFSHEKGYRYTTHKVFRHNNKPYIATFGHPNRLFLIDAETMSIWYHYDIDKDFLTDQKDCRKYVNDVYPKQIFDPYRMTALNVSSDGKYLIFMNQEEVLFFDIAKKEIVERVQYLEQKFKDDGFGQLTLHCDYLEY